MTRAQRKSHRPVPENTFIIRAAERGVAKLQQQKASVQKTRKSPRIGNCRVCDTGLDCLRMAVNVFRESFSPIFATTRVLGYYTLAN